MRPAFFQCPNCLKPIGAWLEYTGTFRKDTFDDLVSWDGPAWQKDWKVDEIWPEPAKDSTPDDVPPAAARSFVQAEENRQRKNYEAAGMSYRRCLEISLKTAAPDAKGMLDARIKAMAQTGQLTPDLASWANTVKLLGNEAAHGRTHPKQGRH